MAMKVCQAKGRNLPPHRERTRSQLSFFLISFLPHMRLLVSVIQTPYHALLKKLGNTLESVEVTSGYLFKPETKVRAGFQVHVG